MAQAATHHFFVDPRHTGGRSVYSDILLSADFLTRLWGGMAGCDLLDSEDGYDDEGADEVFFDGDFDEDEVGDGEDGFLEVDDPMGPLLVWRGPKRGS